MSRRNQLLATAESCTGGWLAKVCTDRAGSSGWFERGFVTYSNAAKRELLGVQAETLARHGAVSRETVLEMVAGALAHSHAHWALAISGIAGPGGGSDQKPVGTVCFGFAIGDRVISEKQWFDGDRQAVRQSTLGHALQRINQLLGSA